MVIAGVVYYNHTANGECKVGPNGKPVNYTDEQFIRISLYAEYGSALSKLPDHFGATQEDDGKIVDAQITDLIKNYPECCKVYREKDRSDRNIRELSKWIWHDSVVVRRYSERLKQLLKSGKQPSEMDTFNQVSYIQVDNCLSSSFYLDAPGG